MRPTLPTTSIQFIASSPAIESLRLLSWLLFCPDVSCRRSDRSVEFEARRWIQEWLGHISGKVHRNFSAPLVWSACLYVLRGCRRRRQACWLNMRPWDRHRSFWIHWVKMNGTYFGLFIYCGTRRTGMVQEREFPRSRWDSCLDLDGWKSQKQSPVMKFKARRASSQLSLT